MLVVTHYLNTSDDDCPLGIEETNEREAEALKCLKDLSDGENPRNISFEKNFKDFALPKTPILPGKKLKGPKHSSLPLTPTQPDEKSMTFEAVAALLLSPKGLFSSLQNTAESFDEKIKKVTLAYK